MPCVGDLASAFSLSALHWPTLGRFCPCVEQRASQVLFSAVSPFLGPYEKACGPKLPHDDKKKLAQFGTDALTPTHPPKQTHKGFASVPVLLSSSQGSFPLRGGASPLNYGSSPPENPCCWLGPEPVPTGLARLILPPQAGSVWPARGRFSLRSLCLPSAQPVSPAGPTREQQGRLSPHTRFPRPRAACLRKTRLEGAEDFADSPLRASTELTRLRPSRATQTSGRLSPSLLLDFKKKREKSNRD